MLAVVNVGEDELDAIPAAEATVAAELDDAGDNVEVIGMCVQLEAEAATIVDPAERAEMLEGFGLGEGALFRMVRSAYHLLGLRTFLTTGDKESRAWTFYEGSTAPQCAGRIHTDFQRGFIRAEVIHWDELLEIGSWTKAKEVGKIRVEGKDYHRPGRRRHGVPLQRLTGLRPARRAGRARDVMLCGAGGELPTFGRAR